MTTKYSVIRIKNTGENEGNFQCTQYRAYRNKAAAEELRNGLQRRYEHSNPGEYRFGILEVEA